jgi:glutathione S-transferase
VNHFSRAAPEKIPYAITRFQNETLRVFGVLEIQLSGKYGDGPRNYLVGEGKGKYSVADIKAWAWVKACRSENCESSAIQSELIRNYWSKIDILCVLGERVGFTKQQVEHFPHLLQWVDRIAARPAVQRGIGEAYNQK